MNRHLKLSGLIVGLIGNVAVAYALFTLIRGSGCIGPASACNDAAMPGLIALPVGIVASVIGQSMGGGFWILCGLFLAIGAGSMAAGALSNVSETQTFGWIFGGMFFLGGLLPLLLGGAAGAAAQKREKLAMSLVERGAKGIGTITEVRDTGVTVNDDPRVEIVMHVEPIDGSPAVERRKTVTVSRLSVPRVGERFPVWYDRSDAAAWAFATDVQERAPAEVRELFERAKAKGGGGAVDELTQLNALRVAGALTEHEFAEAKERLLARIGR